MRRPQSVRTTRRELDVQLVQKATARIAEISQRLDDASAGEQTEAARMTRLRDATNQIVRLANDAIQAYRRVSLSAKADLASGREDRRDVVRLQRSMREARAELMSELRRASRRYPWADPWPGDEPRSTADPEAATSPGEDRGSSESWLTGG